MPGGVSCPASLFGAGRPVHERLPGDDFIDQLSLFIRGFVKVNARGFNAVMSHQICQQ